MTKSKAFLSLTGAAIIVGSTIVISRIISTGGSIYCLQLISMVIAAIVLAGFIGKDNLKMELKKIQRKDYLIFFFKLSQELYYFVYL